MEIWRKINSLYNISSFGQIKKGGRILKGGIDSKGYKYHCLKINGVQKNYLLHRLVCRYFIGESPLTVNHIDFNKLNNNIDNLEYKSLSDNITHYYENLKKTSKVIGVYQQAKTKIWVSRVYVNKWPIYLGSFKSEEEAILNLYIFYNQKNKSKWD